MKISHLEIKEFNQFRNFTLDLTYPAGHPEKAGQPLDKVCFIGQSGTGKTTLLEIIKSFMHQSYSEMNFTTPIKIVKKFGNISVEIEIYRDLKEKKLVRKTDYAPLSLDEWRKIYLDHYKDSFLFLYFPAELIDKMTKFSIRREIAKSNDAFISALEYSDVLEGDREIIMKNNFIDFSDESLNAEIWRFIFRDMLYYKEKIILFKQNIADASLARDVAAVRNLSEEYQEWLSGRDNPFIKFSLLMDKMINKFNLKIKTDFEFNSFEKIDFLEIVNIKDNKIIPFRNLSTGTKQLLITFTPLISLVDYCKNSIILMDEPERSLYPDIQKIVSDIYTNLLPTSQFFFATHSPIIASTFEPWEIVELKFNEEGFVYQEQYYTGERHVDNYTIDPRYLRWDQILTRVFDVEEEGNMAFRTPKLMEVAELEAALQYLKETHASPEAKHQKWVEFKKAAALVDWDIEQPKYAQDR